VRNSSEVRELMTNSDLNPDSLSLLAISDMLFQNHHFCNLLGDLLSYKPSSAKVERFFVAQIK
jgi:hypothetical protein